MATTELMVHNCSHSDLILGLAHADGCEGAGFPDGRCTTPTPTHRPELFARPKFSHFEPVSASIISALRERPEMATTLNTLLEAGDLEQGPGTPSTHVEESVPVGLGLQSYSLRGASWCDFHLRRSAVVSAAAPPVFLSVYLPIAAQLVKTWTAGAAPGSRRTLVLVSGAGRPRNREHSAIGNSTKACAELIELFVRRHYPDVNVMLLDSGCGVFRYDQNVQFVRNRLLPSIQSIRSGLAATYGDCWNGHLTVTIALADGTPARTMAIAASLRPYSPTFYHMWQLKTFWHEHRLFASDLQHHSFENIETAPSVSFDDLDGPTRLLCEEMRRHKAHFIRSLEVADDDAHVLEGGNPVPGEELLGFWLRKTHKPVLAVLMVKDRHTGAPVFYRGMNVEVSMPTGSLCAERNVIGTALAANPTLRRQDICMVAVLAVHLPVMLGAESHAAPSPSASKRRRLHEASPKDTDAHRERSFSECSLPSIGVHKNSTRNPLEPCGACNEWLRKIAEVNPSFKVVTFENEACDRVFVAEVK